MNIFQANLKQKAAIVAISKTNRRQKRHMAPEVLFYIERINLKHYIYIIV